MERKNANNMKAEHTQQIPVQASPPYPEIAVSNRNVSYAQILSADLAGPHGEMTAIYQYVYQSWVLHSQYSAMAETMTRIAKVEMHHLYIVGQLITQLGGNPKCQYFQNRRAFAWNGSSVNYIQNIQELLKANIAAEQYAADMYLKHAKIIQDGDVSEVLARLSLDEMEHKSIFEGLLAEFTATQVKPAK